MPVGAEQREQRQQAILKILRQRLDVRTQQCSIVYGVPRGLTLDHCSFADPCALDSAATVRESSSPRMGGFGL